MQSEFELKKKGEIVADSRGWMQAMNTNKNLLFIAAETEYGNLLRLGA